MSNRFPHENYQQNAALYAADKHKRKKYTCPESLIMPKEVGKHNRDEEEIRKTFREKYNMYLYIYAWSTDQIFIESQSILFRAIIILCACEKCTSSRGWKTELCGANVLVCVRAIK